MASTRARRSRRSRKRLEKWVGPWLRGMREAEKEKDSLDDIAQRLGRDRGSISRIETGKQSIPADDLPLFLTAYGLTADDFAERARDAA